MSLIQVKNLSFHYDGSYDDIFNHASFQFDSCHKTALIGRNARGKTTFLKLLMGEYEYKGEIMKSVDCQYFPYDVKEKEMLTIDVCEEIDSNIELWQIKRELNLLDVDADELMYRVFETLSLGEQTKVLLAVLFLKENSFLLIDEPTNHLDQQSRESVAAYLKKQKGFLLVSHDRYFIDQCCNHIIAINPTSIEVVSGNFSSWYENKVRKDQGEIERNIKLRKDIQVMEKSKRQKADWSDRVEKSKMGAADKGYVGHMAAKMMKRSKSIEARQNKAIEEKRSLLKDIEEYDDLKMFPLDYMKTKLISFNHVSLFYNDKILFKDLSFDIQTHDRVLLKGKNGCGKSSVIRLIMDEKIGVSGDFYKGSQLKISYVFQDCSTIHGTFEEVITHYDVNETLVKTILRKLGFARVHFEKRLEQLSEGQKKKVMLAISLATPAHLYIFDEPLNYIDIFSRMQIEKLILEYQPTLLFVEHDRFFQKTIATKVIDFDELV